MTINQTNWSQGYPWGAFADLREVLLISSNPPLNDKSVVTSSNGEDIVVPQLGRVCLEFSVNGQNYYTPWIAVNQNNLLIPIARDIRSNFNVVLESNTGQNLTFELLNASEID